MSQQSNLEQHDQSKSRLKKFIQQDFNFSSSSDNQEVLKRLTTSKKDRPTLYYSQMSILPENEQPTPKKSIYKPQAISLKQSYNKKDLIDQQIQNILPSHQNNQLIEEHPLGLEQQQKVQEIDLTLNKVPQYSDTDFLSKQQCQNPENLSLLLEQIICSYIHHNLSEKSRTSKYLFSQIKLIDKQFFDTHHFFWKQANYKKALKYITMIILSILRGVQEDKILKQEIQVKMQLTEQNIRKQVQKRNRRKELQHTDFNDDSQGSNIPQPNIFQQSKRARQIKLTDFTEYIANQFLYYFIRGSSLDNLLIFIKKVRRRIVGKDLQHKLRKIQFRKMRINQEIINKNIPRLNQDQQKKMIQDDDVIMDIAQQDEIYEIVSFRSLKFINIPKNISLNSECHCHISRQRRIQQIQVVRCQRCLRAYHLFCQTQLYFCSKCYQWQLSLKTYPIEQLVCFYIFCKKDSWYNIPQQLKFSLDSTTSKIYDSKIYSTTFVIQNFKEERSAGKFNKDVQIRVHKVFDSNSEKERNRQQKLQQLKSEVDVWTNQVLIKIQKQQIRGNNQNDLQQFFKYYSIYVNNRLIPSKKAGDALVKIPCYLLQQKNILIVRRISLKALKKKTNVKDVKKQPQIIDPEKSIFMVGVYKTQKISKPKPVRLTSQQYKNIIRMHPFFQQNRQNNWIVQNLNCPASQLMDKKPIKSPVRGYNCRHFQCFDLDVFIKNVFSKKPSRKQITQQAKKTEEKLTGKQKNNISYQFNKKTIKQQNLYGKIVSIDQKVINLQENQEEGIRLVEQQQHIRFKRQHTYQLSPNKAIKLQNIYTQTTKRLSKELIRAQRLKQMKRQKQIKRRKEMLNNIYHQKSLKCPICHKLLGNLLIDPFFQDVLKEIENLKQKQQNINPIKNFYFNKVGKYYFDKITLLRDEQNEDFPENPRKNQKPQKYIQIGDESEAEVQDDCMMQVESYNSQSGNENSQSQEQNQENCIEIDESSSQSQNE